MIANLVVFKAREIVGEAFIDDPEVKRKKNPTVSFFLYKNKSLLSSHKNVSQRLQIRHIGHILATLAIYWKSSQHNNAWHVFDQCSLMALYGDLWFLTASKCKFLFIFQSQGFLRQSLKICAAFRGTYLDTKDKADEINTFKVEEQAELK